MIFFSHQSADCCLGRRRVLGIGSRHLMRCVLRLARGFRLERLSGAALRLPPVAAELRAALRQAAATGWALTGGSCSSCSGLGRRRWPSHVTSSLWHLSRQHVLHSPCWHLPLCGAPDDTQREIINQTQPIPSITSKNATRKALAKKSFDRNKKHN